MPATEPIMPQQGAATAMATSGAASGGVAAGKETPFGPLETVTYHEKKETDDLALW